MLQREYLALLLTLSTWPSRSMCRESLAMLRKIVEEKPDYAEARYSLGQALLEKGSVKQAIEQLETSVRLDPDKPYSHYQLGRAYLRAGRRADAQKQFEVSQQLEDRQKRPTNLYQ